MRVARLAAPTVLFLIACHDQPSPPAATEVPKAPAAPPKVEPAATPAPSAGPKRLSFEIVNVYTDQSVQSTPPWHANGGDWKFFDAKTQAGTTFTVGIPPRMPPSPKSIGFDQSVIATSSRAEGAKLVDELAHALGVAPPPKGPKKPIHALQVTTFTRTDNAVRNPDGDFGGVGGGWSATKWTVDANGDEADIYFNYNLGAKQGEWAEKDADSDPLFIAALARAVRDGADEAK